MITTPIRDKELNSESVSTQPQAESLVRTLGIHTASNRNEPPVRCVHAIGSPSIHAKIQMLSLAGIRTPEQSSLPVVRAGIEPATYELYLIALPAELAQLALVHRENPSRGTREPQRGVSRWTMNQSEMDAEGIEPPAGGRCNPSPRHDQ